MTPIIRTAVLLAASCFAVCCNHRPSNFEGGESVVAKEMSVSPPPAIAARLPEQDRHEAMLIKKARLALVVDNIESTRSDISRICQESGAYVYSDEQYDETDRLSSRQTIRVPVDHFDSVLTRLERLGKAVENRTIEVSDVTEEFVDLQARIRAKKNLESRYFEILKKASKVTDMLAIEDELNKVRTDIERMEGRVGYLGNQVAYSTITIDYHEPVVVTDYGFNSKLVEAMIKGWDGLLSLVLGLTTIWPFVIMISVAVVLLRRKVLTRAKPPLTA